MREARGEFAQRRSPAVTSEAIPDQLIAQARGGDEAALGILLELYRNYLRLVARSLIGVALRVKLEPSDVVQETFLKAHQEFGGFRGQDERQLIAWLRRILTSTLADQDSPGRRNRGSWSLPCLARFPLGHARQHQPPGAPRPNSRRSRDPPSSPSGFPRMAGKVRRHADRVDQLVAGRCGQGFPIS